MLSEDPHPDMELHNGCDVDLCYGQAVTDTGILGTAIIA